AVGPLVAAGGAEIDAEEQRVGGQEGEIRLQGAAELGEGDGAAEVGIGAGARLAASDTGDVADAGRDLRVEAPLLSLEGKEDVGLVELRAPPDHAGAGRGEDRKSTRLNSSHRT